MEKQQTIYLDPEDFEKAIRGNRSIKNTFSLRKGDHVVILCSDWHYCSYPICGQIIKDFTIKEGAFFKTSKCRREDIEKLWVNRDQQ